MFKTFANGEVLEAADVNNYLMRQGVIVCTTTAQRNAIPTPNEGMVIWLAVSGQVARFQIRTGGSWVDFYPFKPFAIAEGSTVGSSSITNVGTNLAPVTGGAALSVAVTATRACTVRATLRVRLDTGGDTIGLEAGIDVSGATTLAIPSGDLRATTFYGAGPQTVNHTQVLNIAAGVNTFKAAARAVGAGGARNYTNPHIIIEPLT